MPHLSGVFEEFPNLDTISVDEILTWLKDKPEVHYLVNFLGNRILYPQAIPITLKELEVDLGILRSAIKLKPSLVYQPQANRILIPKLFIDRFGALANLAKAIIEGINPKGVHKIFIKERNTEKLAGSVISPLSPQKLSNNERTVNFTGLSIQKELPLGVVSQIDTPAPDIKIKLGTEEYQVSGGEAGLFIDLRMGEFV